MQQRERQSGLSLVEAMISLVISAIIVAALIAYFVSGHRNYRQDQEQARMQESARFALKILGDDITMLGFYGQSFSLTNTVSATITNVCGTGAGNPLNLGSTLQVLGNTSNPNATFPCIDDADFVDGSDVLALKRVAGQPLSMAGQLTVNNLYFRGTPSSNGVLVKYTDGSFADGASYWPYRVNVYYIRDESLIGSGDGIPTLYRKSLQGLAMADNDGGIARGIEFFHVEFGIDQEAVDADRDTRPDGVPNFYTATPTATQLPGVITAKIYVLARSRDEITGYENEKTYTMGAVTKGPFDDGYYRRMFSTTVRLRNFYTRAVVNHIVQKNAS